MDKKKNGNGSTLPVGIAMGVGTGIIILLGLSALMAALISGEKMSPGSVGYGVLILLMLSSFCAAAAASAKVKNKRLIVSLVTAAVYLLALLCITALFFDGMYDGVLQTGLVVLGGGAVNGLLAAGKGSGRKTARHKRRYG